MPGSAPRFFEGDVCDRELLSKIFAQRPVDSVIHFAGLKAVGESVAQPLRYYDCNVGGAIILCGDGRRASSRSFQFVGDRFMAIRRRCRSARDFPRSTTNPYGANKLMIEDILADLYKSDPEWRIARLRYFNPVGAHPSGLIGESPSGIPNNLMPYVLQVACGQRAQLSVFGATIRRRTEQGARLHPSPVDRRGHVAALELSGA